MIHLQLIHYATKKPKTETLDFLKQSPFYYMSKMLKKKGNFSSSLSTSSLIRVKLQGCLEKSLKRLLINYNILLPNFLVFIGNDEENLTSHQKSLKVLFHTPLQLIVNVIIVVIIVIVVIIRISEY